MATDWVGFTKPVEAEGKSKDALWREEGIGRGGCLGFLMGTLYCPMIVAAAGLLILLILPATPGGILSPIADSTSDTRTWEDDFLVVGKIWVGLFFMSGLPSAVIGAVTGGLLASRMERMSSATGRQVTFVALRIGFVVLLVVHALYLLLWHNFTPQYWDLYRLFLGIPSPIFLCLAVVVAHKMRPRGDLTAPDEVQSVETEAI